MTGLYSKSLLIDHGAGRKLGLIGFLGTDAEYLADTGGLRFTDEVAAINAEAANLMRSGANFIVVLGTFIGRR